MKKSECGPCGLYCGACGEPTCDGCRSSKVQDWAKQCTFRHCAQQRHVEFCCFCSDYPCTELREFMNDQWPHHWTMKPNLRYIEQNGKEKWLQTQKQQWSCKNCGTEIKWYQKMCNCGQQLNAWDLPTAHN
ncbi:MAG: DUF3795 domain-containing protein [candidate division WOR-3 bacterium]|nr:MAG: DUF3795 domain-containing protein [candidate division WOR-3 bacterium]